MIQPISLKEYMDKISRKYHSLPEGTEKNELWKEIKRIANRSEPTIRIEDVSDNDEQLNSEKK